MESGLILVCNFSIFNKYTGPLLYHYAEMPKECSIELSYDELKFVIEKVGFSIENEEIRDCPYTTQKNSMMSIVYKCVFFTAVKRKPAESEPSPEEEKKINFKESEELEEERKLEGEKIVEKKNDIP